MQERDDGRPLLEGLEELPQGSLQLPEAPPGLQAKVLTQTAVVVRSRRRRRHVKTLALFLVVYTAGVGTAVLLQSQASGPDHLSRPDSTRDAEVALAPAEILREVPTASPSEQRRLLKLAGDSYLSSHADVERALYCYRQLLELTPTERKGLPKPDDSWLLVALKQDRSIDTRR